MTPGILNSQEIKSDFNSKMLNFDAVLPVAEHATHPEYITQLSITQKSWVDTLQSFQRFPRPQKPILISVKL